MPNGIVSIPPPVNEPIRAYAPGAPEKASLKAKINEMLTEEIEIPLIIGGKEVRTGNTAKAVCPHDHGHVLGDLPQGRRGGGPAGDRRRRRRPGRSGRRCPGSTARP